MHGIQKAMAYLPVSHFLFFLSLRKGVRKWPSSMFTTHFLCARICYLPNHYPMLNIKIIFLIPHFNILETLITDMWYLYLTLININTYITFNPLSIFFTRTPKDCLYFLHLCPAAALSPFFIISVDTQSLFIPWLSLEYSLNFCNLILPYNNLNNCLNSLRQ